MLLIENEGPRPLFRAKLGRKREGWGGSNLGERIQVLETPWARVTFADEHHRQAVAAKVAELEVDVVIAVPVTNLGMNEAGTLQEVRDFMRLVAALRQLTGRPLTVVLIHHENKGGQVSGRRHAPPRSRARAWTYPRPRPESPVGKRLPRDHAQPHMDRRGGLRGRGEARVRRQRDRRPTPRGRRQQSRGLAGQRWRDETRGINRQRRMAVRDRLLIGGRLVNIAEEDGREIALAYCPERRPSRLYRTDDPTISHLLPARGAGGEQIAPSRVREVRCLCSLLPAL